MKKSIIILLVALVSMLFLLSSCTHDTDPEERTLWIVTEESRITDGMNWQTEQIIKAFKKENPDVTVTLEILPNETDHAQERSVRLEQIRTDILAGKGPDVYLIPNETLMNEPLFKDVQQAMYNGVFADISSYYDADTTLGKEDLVTEVMDGGVVNGARYVLPLRYTYPVLYTDRQIMQAAGLGLEAASDFNSLFNVLLTASEPQWHCTPASSAATGYASFLPPMIDYASGKVLINETQMADLLRKYQSMADMVAISFGMSSYISKGTFFTEQQPIDMGWLHQVLDFSAISQVENQDLVAIPVRATNGDLVASVSYYAAVGNGCSNPELAYKFIREFLTEDVQFERERLELSKYSATTIASGLPVRSKGKTDELWTMYKKINKGFGSDEEQMRRKKAVMAVSLTQADVPILDAHIDRVYFATSFDQQAMVDAVRKVLFEDADINTVAKDLIFQLQLHAAEG